MKRGPCLLRGTREGRSVRLVAVRDRTGRHRPDPGASDLLDDAAPIPGSEVRSQRGLAGMLARFAASKLEELWKRR